MLNTELFVHLMFKSLEKPICQSVDNVALIEHCLYVTTQIFF